MPHDTANPFRICRPAADNAADLFPQTANNRTFGEAVIVHIDRCISPLIAATLADSPPAN